MENTEEKYVEKSKDREKSTGKWNAVFSIPFHYSIYCSSIFSISYLYSTYLSPIISIFFSLFNWLFFHIFHIFSSRLNSEMIWKLWKKNKLNSDKIWKIWKKGKLNSGKIWRISISFHNFLLHFPNLFTIELGFLLYFLYIFTIQLAF
jgi:hypothetical protein